jgi:lipopolysaccharide/colanic/teichoic acid biosynthesis glycosyltransferase
MIAVAEPRRIARELPEPTLWGLTPTALHDRFWTAQGLCVVRRGEPAPLPPAPCAYLLIAPLSLVLFRLPMPLPVLLWTARKLAIARVVQEQDYRVCENVVANADHSFVRIDRFLQRHRADLSRIAITTSRELAQSWQSLADPAPAWRTLRAAAERHATFPRTLPGLIFDRKDPDQVDAFARGLPLFWPRPSTTIQGIECSNSGVWKPSQADVAVNARIIGSVWLGAGRSIAADDVIAGPAVLWDDLGASARIVRAGGPRRLRASTSVESPIVVRRRSRFERALKRSLDILTALVLLTVTLPLTLLVMLTIRLHDGRPALVSRRRLTLRGREFRCWKFRVLHKEAERLQAVQRGQTDSYAPRDPRVTTIGRLIQRFGIDGIPQFVNVLLGHLSIVGPRPSAPDDDHGGSSWREARLSVRPGITGLWRVMPLRQAGDDFQDWGRYDVQYVESGGLGMDMRIIARTLAQMVFGK